MAGFGAQRGRKAGLAARAGRAGLLPDRGPGHRHRSGPAVAVPEDRGQPDRAAGLRRRVPVPGGRATAGMPQAVSRVQGVRRAQRRSRPVPVAGRRDAASERGRRRRRTGRHRRSGRGVGRGQRGADPVGRGHTRPRGVHRRNRQSGRGL